jgi:hypothetical protein
MRVGRAATKAYSAATKKALQATRRNRSTICSPVLNGRAYSEAAARRRATTTALYVA